MWDTEILGSVWFLLVVGLLLGMVMGSFTTMLAYRLPRGISIVSPPSHCPSCKTRLTPRDLVPIFSWLINGGKCRHCGSEIGAKYLIIEIAITLSCVAAILSF